MELGTPRPTEANPLALGTLIVAYSCYAVKNKLNGTKIIPRGNTHLCKGGLAEQHQSVTKLSARPQATGFISRV
jgi:hypothetical protein